MVLAQSALRQPQADCMRVVKALAVRAPPRPSHARLCYWLQMGCSDTALQHTCQAAAEQARDDRADAVGALGVRAAATLLVRLHAFVKHQHSWLHIGRVGRWDGRRQQRASRAAVK